MTLMLMMIQLVDEGKLANGNGVCFLSGSGTNVSIIKMSLFPFKSLERLYFISSLFFFLLIQTVFFSSSCLCTLHAALIIPLSPPCDISRRCVSLAGPQSRLVATGESYIVSSDEDEDAPPVVSGGVTSALQASSLSR